MWLVMQDIINNTLIYLDVLKDTYVHLILMYILEYIIISSLLYYSRYIDTPYILCLWRLSEIVIGVSLSGINENSDAAPDIVYWVARRA